MNKAALLMSVLAVFAFGSAQACDWMNKSSKVNYAKVEKSTPKPSVKEQPVVVEIREQDNTVAVTIDPVSTAN